MVCNDCAVRNHKACVNRNQGKSYSDCDCQHRVNEKTKDNNGDGKES